MVLAINILLTAVCIAIMASMTAFFLECLLAILPQRKKISAHASRHPATVVLIPAHNEESVLEQSLRVLVSTLPVGDRALLIADNCDDGTVEIAQRAGAEVIVRRDPTRRGKGYALEFAAKHLRAKPPEVVVILDADCLVSPDTVRILAQQAFENGRPVQGLNLTDRLPPTGSSQVLAILANRLTNLIRPLGLSRLGLPCRLMGTGLAVPWAHLEKVPFAGENLVEDMQWGIDLALAGFLPLFCPQARVTSALPPQHRAFLKQRTRWEHGHLRTIALEVPRLLAKSLWRRDYRLFCLAWDLSIPPLTLLAGSWAAAIISSLAAVAAGASAWPAGALCLGGVMTVLAFAGAWFVHCRKQVPFRALFTAPFYILRKLPIYIKFILNPQNSWVRTDRDEIAYSDPTR
jgi:cellulose synthase/poly-beta-1,6-N-acetylglucosamine synthase-like glycosyltransferase